MKREVKAAFLKINVPSSLLRKEAVLKVLECDFQERLIKKLKSLFPGCIVLKNDPSYIQGFPDLTIFYGDKWAVLECKASERAKRQPNQEFYIEHMNNMSFGRFIFPENEEDVLNELSAAF